MCVVRMACTLYDWCMYIYLLKAKGCVGVACVNFLLAGANNLINNKKNIGCLESLTNGRLNIFV